MEKTSSSEFTNNLYNPNFLYASNKNAIESFTLKNGIDIDHVRSLSPEDRNIFLISNLFTRHDLEKTSKDQYIRGNEYLHDDEYGMLIVKPEMFPHVKHIELFLSDIGIKYQSLNRIKPTKRNWLDTYGYMLADFPNIVNVYITQVNFGIQPIIFRHLPISEYRRIANERGFQLETTDRDAAFDQLYCGKARAGFNGTIRHDVVLPKLNNLGFNDMSGYAANFDTFNYYKDASPEKTYISFNGVHVPKNRYEKEKNIQTYITSVMTS